MTTFSPAILRPITVLTDWLTVNMQGPWRYMVHTDCETRSWETRWGQFLYRTKPYGTATHKRVDTVHDLKGELLATITSEPGGALCHDVAWCQVTFSNATSVTGEWYNLYRALRAHGMEYRDLSRLDIAADALAEDGGDFLGVIERARAGDGRYYGKASWRTEHERSKVTGATFGRRGGDKYLRVYCKSRELKQKGDKPHIRAAWCAAMGGEVLGDRAVNRLEVELRCKEIKRYFRDSTSEDWMVKLHVPEFRRDVFASTVPSLFDFRTYPESGRARDARPLCVWDWSNCATWDERLRLRQERNFAISDQQLKLGLRNTWRVAKAMSAPQLFDVCKAQAVAGGEHIEAWYEKAVAKWEKEYAHTVKEGDERTRIYLTNLSNSAADID